MALRSKGERENEKTYKGKTYYKLADDEWKYCDMICISEQVVKNIIDGKRFYDYQFYYDQLDFI